MDKKTFEEEQKYNQMLVFKMTVNRKGKTYDDYYLAWVYNNKVYDARIRPVFQDSYRCLINNAVIVNSVDDIKRIAKSILNLTK